MNNKAFTIRVGVDDANKFFPDFEAPAIFASTAFDNMVGKEITIDGTIAKVLDANVAPGGAVADLMVEVVKEDCDCD